MTHALLSGAIAALIAAALGGSVIRFLRSRGLAKAISADGPQSHMSKAGTPTMGGLLIFGVAIAVALVSAVPKDSDIILPIVVVAILLAIGVYDDAGTLIDREKRQAHDRAGMMLKLVGFAGIAIVAALLLHGPLDAPRLLIPGRDNRYDIGVLYVLVAIGVIISVISAVGVTDGLDMLGGGTTAVAYTSFGAIALMQDQVALAVFAFSVVGALIGFLYWNAFPARLFMGDAGALPLGGGLAIVALMSGWWVLVPLVGIVFLVEIMSVCIQIFVFRTQNGRRFFRMAPIHHHFEKLDWHEVTITSRFIALGVVGGLLGVALAAW